MTILIIPAAISLVLKLGLLFLLFGKSSNSKSFLPMVAVFACHNLCEVLAYTQFFSGGSVDWIVRGYYCLSVWGMCYMVIYASDTAKFKGTQAVAASLMTFAALASFVFMLTDFVIAKPTIENALIKAGRGPLYWTFQVSVFALMWAVLATLFNGYRSKSDHDTQTKCIYSLVAIAPLALVGPGVILLQEAGFGINTTLILPVCSTLYLLVIALGESKHRLTDIRIYLPFSVERKTAAELMATCAKFSSTSISLKDASSEIERVLIMHSLQKTNFNVKRSARMMNMNRSTLYSACKRLGIQLSPEQ